MMGKIKESMGNAGSYENSRELWEIGLLRREAEKTETSIPQESPPMGHFFYAICE